MIRDTSRMGTKKPQVALKREIRDSEGELCNQILVARDCEGEKMEIAEDRLRVFRSTPLEYSVGKIVKVLNSVSAKQIFRRYLEAKGKLWTGECWEDGYFV